MQNCIFVKHWMLLEFFCVLLYNGITEKSPLFQSGFSVGASVLCEEPLLTLISKSADCTCCVYKKNVSRSNVKMRPLQTK